MPSIPDLVYAALLYKDDAAPENPPHKDFASGREVENGKLIFLFQRPDEKSGLSVAGEAIEINDPIALTVYSLSEVRGTVRLKIQVPKECSLEIDDTANFGCKKDEDASDTYTISASGIATGAYLLKFTVKKGSEIVHIFSEYINVINGLCTDTWNGLGKDGAKKITQNMISSTVYVRGAGGYYDNTESYKDTATANDGNAGIFLMPLASIQKAIDKIIAINDGSSAYTIYVDGILDGMSATTLGSEGLADFSALGENLNLTIKALSGTATLDGGARFNESGTVTNVGIEKRVIYASSERFTLNLTLENFVIKGGNVVGGTISENTAQRGSCIYNTSSLVLQDGIISGDVCVKNDKNNSLKLLGNAVITDGVIDFTEFTDPSETKKYISIGELAKDFVATIKLGTAYQSGDIILFPTSGSLTEADCKRFTIDGGAYGIVLSDGKGVLGIE
ncbi:MAG: hypothetical protein HDR51_06225 [Treponema sp.]|nr:hypothetical protein [Treponema sp.]